MNVSVTVDTRSFDAAMREYLEHTSKTAADAVNKALRDAALRSVHYVPQSDRNTLGLWRALANSDPGGYISPFVAYLIRRQKEKSGSPFLAGVKYSRRAVRTMGRTGRLYSRPEAKRFAKRVFASRYRSQTFLRAFFLAAANRLSAIALGGGSRAGAKAVPQLAVTVSPATPARTQGGFSVAYAYKRGNPHGERASAILTRALNLGLAEKAADMREYIARKLAEKARAISGR